MRNLKLIWDFRGQDALITATHHKNHLIDYCDFKEISTITIGTEKINNMHCITYLAVSEDDMLPIRDQLKPHRATLYSK